MPQPFLFASCAPTGACRRDEVAAAAMPSSLPAATALSPFARRHGEISLISVLCGAVPAPKHVDSFQALRYKKVYTTCQHVVSINFDMDGSQMFDANVENLKRKFAEYRKAIENADDMPAYKALQYMILKAIEHGDWQPGQLIPPERIFVQCTDMSIGTVKKAMLNLVHDGVLFRRQGSGTYVAMPSFTRQMRRYYLFLDDFSGKESENTIALHSFRTIEPVSYINAMLHIHENEKLIEIKRIFKEEGGVCILSKTWLSATRFSRLDTIVKQRFEHVPLFVILEEEYKITTKRSQELIGIEALCAEDAEILGKNINDSVLKIKTLNYGGDNIPYEYRESLCITGGKFIYRNTSY